jgi:hypothetical protein
VIGETGAVGVIAGIEGRNALVNTAAGDGSGEANPALLPLPLLLPALPPTLPLLLLIGEDSAVHDANSPVMTG